MDKDTTSHNEKEAQKEVPPAWSVKTLAKRANVVPLVARKELRNFFSGLEVSPLVKPFLPDAPPSPTEAKFSFKDRNGTAKTVYIVENDLPLNEKDHLEYKAKVKAKTDLDNQAAMHGLTVALLGQTTPQGKLDRLSPEKARNMTWFLQADTFKGSGIDPEDVESNIRYAMTDWEKVCGVKFRRVQEEKDAYMVVRFTDTSGDPQMESVIAMAFFPSSPPEERIVHIFPGYATATDSVVGILRHELGHVLGFRHEHARLGTLLPEKYREDLTNTVALTKYDPKSVMHYNFTRLGLGGTSALEISELDSQGAKFYYGGSVDVFRDN